VSEFERALGEPCVMASAFGCGNFTMQESSINIWIVGALCATLLVAIVVLYGVEFRSREMRRRLLFAGSAVGAIGAVFLVYAMFLLATGNVHVVVPGELFRSGQLSAGEMTHLIKTYGIKSVLNLRGENAGQPWYREEVKAVKLAGIDHVDFRLSAKNDLSQKEIKDLISIMRSSAKPLLIHCQGGADRTGLAAALYVYVFTDRSEEEAEEQLSIAYGHLGLPFFPGFAMHRTWETFEDLHANANH